MALPFAVQVPASTAPPGQDVLLEFRAGRMSMERSRVIPDTKKGSIRIYRSEDSLLHFAWLDRSTNAIEEDLIVFPDEAVFEKVPQSTSRVYILKFKHDERKLFFWMQEPKADKDSELCQAVNQTLNDTMAWSESQDGQEDAPQQTESEVSQPVDEADSAGTATESSGPTAATSPAQPQGAVQLSDLRSILSSLGQLPVPPGAGARGPLRDPGPSLAEVLRPERIIPLLQNPSVQERLAPHLPEALQTSEAMAELVQSPQFQQQLETFTAALRSGQLDLSQFGIDSSRYGFTVDAFLQAIEDQVDASGAGQAGEAPEASQGAEQGDTGEAGRGGGSAS